MPEQVATFNEWGGTWPDDTVTVEDATKEEIIEVEANGPEVDFETWQKWAMEGPQYGADDGWHDDVPMDPAAYGDANGTAPDVPDMSGISDMPADGGDGADAPAPGAPARGSADGVAPTADGAAADGTDGDGTGGGGGSGHQPPWRHRPKGRGRGRGNGKGRGKNGKHTKWQGKIHANGGRGRNNQDKAKAWNSGKGWKRQWDDDDVSWHGSSSTSTYLVFYSFYSFVSICLPLQKHSM